LFEIEQHYPRTFLYLRTRTSVVFANDALEGLCEIWPHDVDCLLPFRNEATWEDGLVLGLHTDEPPQELARLMNPALTLFDAWAIHNTKGEWVEWTGQGPLSAYFALGAPPLPTAQLFLLFQGTAKAPDEAAIDALRALYGRERCLPTFHFRDGRILLVNTEEPARTIFRRIERSRPTPSRSYHRKPETTRSDYDFCVCDSAGDPFAPDGRPIWERTSLEGLYFVDEDNDDGNR
jgi:hypothetical protein